MGRILSHWLDAIDPSSGPIEHIRGPMQPQLFKARERLMAGVTRLLLQAPTGAGKTTSACLLAKLAREYGAAVVIGVPRTKLCGQFSDRLKSFDVCHSVLAADRMFKGQFDERIAVQVVMGPTLSRRSSKIKLPKAGLLIIDEAHLWGARTFAAIIEEYRKQGAVIIGLTATPCRMDGTPLSSLFDELIPGPTYEELLSSGALVEPRCFSTPTNLDLSGITIRNGDYDLHELADAVSATHLTGGIVENYIRRASGRKALCFAVDTKHGTKIVDAFTEAGIKAELVSFKDNEEKLNAALARLKAGEVHVVVSCTKLSYGVDEPFVDSVIMARPTKSLALWLQAVGRGVRAYPGKRDCIILDHGDCIASNCHPRDPIEWSLSHAPKKKTGAPVMKQCGGCSSYIPGGSKTCPECGIEITGRVVSIVSSNDHLEEVVSVTEMTPARFAAEARDWFVRSYPDRQDRWAKFGRAVVIDRFGVKAADRIDFAQVESSSASPAVIGLMLQRIKAFRARQMAARQAVSA